MASKELTAVLTAVAVLTASCSGTENQPPPGPSSSPSRPETLVVPSPPAGYIGLWPAVNQCPQQGVYVLPEVPDSGLTCRLGAIVKDRIDTSQKVDFINEGDATSIDGLGLCALNLLAIDTEIDGIRSLYAGWARVGQNDEAEVLFFPYEPFAPPEIKAAVLQPTEYGVYAIPQDNGIPTPVGVLVGPPYCPVTPS